MVEKLTLPKENVSLCIFPVKVSHRRMKLYNKQFDKHLRIMRNIFPYKKKKNYLCNLTVIHFLLKNKIIQLYGDHGPETVGQDFHLKSTKESVKIFGNLQQALTSFAVLRPEKLQSKAVQESM